MKNETTMTDTSYNGWKNYETWNVSLYIQNDETFYKIARGCDTYTQWVRSTWDSHTPDGVSYFDGKLDVAALNEMILEL